MLILLLGMLQGPSSEFPALRTLTPRHLGTFITLAADLVLTADGLGLRVVSTAPGLRAYCISLSTAPIVVYSAAEVLKIPELDINLDSGHSTPLTPPKLISS